MTTQEDDLPEPQTVEEMADALDRVALLDELAHDYGATFIEVILAADAALAIDRFRARRRTKTAVERWSWRRRSVAGRPVL